MFRSTPISWIIYARKFCKAKLWISVTTLKHFTSRAFIEGLLYTRVCTGSQITKEKRVRYAPPFLWGRRQVGRRWIRHTRIYDDNAEWWEALGLVFLQSPGHTFRAHAEQARRAQACLGGSCCSPHFYRCLMGTMALSFRSSYFKMISYLLL
jgi:hypothetical protein